MMGDLRVEAVTRTMESPLGSRSPIRPEVETADWRAVFGKTARVPARCFPTSSLRAEFPLSA